MIHSKAGRRETEHHEREETCHVNTCLSERTCIAPEITQVIDTGNVKPEYGVKCMVQTKRNKQSVKECINTRTDSAKAGNTCSKSNQSRIENRPDHKQDCGCHDRAQRRYNRHCTLAAEEGKRIGKLNALKLIVAGSADQTAENTDKLVANFAECRIGFLAGKSCNGSAAEQCGNHQEGNKSRKSCRSVIVI